MLAVCGGKGGVGRTTVAVGVGAALAAQHRPTVVVDADAEMPDLAAVADTPVTPGVDALARGTSLSEATHDAGRGGLGVVPATPGADLAGALARIDGGVLDCPGGARRSVAVPLRAADRALLVTTPTDASIRAARKTATMARELGATVVGVVVTRAEDAEVARAFEAPLLGRIPAVAEPLTAPASRAAYRRLAVRLSRVNFYRWG